MISLFSPRCYYVLLLPFHVVVVVIIVAFHVVVWL